IASPPARGRWDRKEVSPSAGGRSDPSQPQARRAKAMGTRERDQTWGGVKAIPPGQQEACQVSEAAAPPHLPVPPFTRTRGTRGHQSATWHIPAHFEPRPRSAAPRPQSPPSGFQEVGFATTSVLAPPERA